MPERIAIAVGAIVVAQALCAPAILILAFTAPNYVLFVVNVFGFLLAIRSGFVAIYGLARGNLSSRKRRATRVSEPTRFWGGIIGNLAGIGVGIFLMLLPIG